MKRFLLKSFLSVGLIFSAFLGYSQQDHNELASYSFPGNPGSKVMDTNGPFMISGSNFTVSTATENGQNGTFRANGFPAGALSTTSYYEVIITPSAGHKIDFSTFIFDANRGSAGAGPANWSVRVSPYSSDIGTGSLSNGGNADQSSNISSLTGITAATTFRIYFYNGAGDLGLDNVRINGVVTPVAAKTLATFSFASAATPDAGGPSTISVSPVSVTGSPTDVGVTAGVYRTGGAAGWSNNAAGNPDFTQYYEITITPNSGYKIDFQSFIFDFTATDASVGARDWAIRTSPFSSDLGGGTGMTRNVLNINQSADLSSITNATGATVLRLTFFASGNNDVLNLDNVRISGTISAITPTSSLSTLNFSSVTTNSMTANWTPATGTGNTGTNRLVIARLNGAVTASPTDLNTYANNAAFGTVSTDPIVAGDYILYNGTGASVPVTGLGNGEYYYAIYPFNGPGGLERYKTTAPITGRQGTVPSAQPTSITFTSPIATGYTVGWTAVSGVNGYIAIRNAGSSPTDATPATLVNGTSYTVGNALLGGTIAYIGTSASFNETTLTAGTDYFYDIYSYNGTTGNASITYLNSTAPLSGNKIVLSAEPTAAVNTPTFSNITNSTIDVNWTPATTVGGTGANRLVIGRKGGAVTSVPVDGTTYNSNAAFGTVGTDQMVAGDFVVYAGPAATVPVTALSNGEYYFTIYTYNGSGGDENYYTVASASARQGTTPSAQPTVLTFTSLLNNGTGYTVGWTAIGAPTVSGYIAIRNSGSSPTDATPATLVNGTTYSVGAALLGGTVAYVGSSNSFNETTLTPGTDYYYDIYSYNGTPGNTSITYLNSTAPLSGNRFTLEAEPTVQANNIVFTNINTGAGTMTLTWSNGNSSPSNRIVIGRAGSAISYTAPVDGAPVPATAPSLDITDANSDITGFSGNHLLYSGSANTIVVSGLTAGSVYHFQIFEVNGSGASTNYFTSTAVKNPNNTLFIDPATNITFTSILNTNLIVNFANGGGAGRIVVARAGSPITTDPSNGVSYPVNAFGTGASQIGVGNYVVASASGATVTGLTANTTYFFKVYERDASNNYVLSNTTGNDNTISTPTANEPANHVTAFTTGVTTSSTVPLSWTGSVGLPAPSKYLLLARDFTAGGSFYVVADNATTPDQSDVSLADAARNINFGTNSFNAWTGLIAGHRYDFIIYPYTTGSLLYNVADYKIAGAPTASAYTEPAAQPTALPFTNILPNSFDVNFAAEPSASGYVVFRNTVAVTASPVDGVQYTAGNTLGSDLIAYVGPLTSFSEAGLNPSTNYKYRVYAYSGLASSPNYLTSSPLSMNQTTGPPAVIGTIVPGPGSVIGFISSLTTTQGASHALNTSFDFTITDDAGSGGDLSRTKISTITINLDGASTIASLSAVLPVGGAELWDGVNTALVASSITANTIVFSAIPNADGQLGDIADNQPKNYSVRIWLKSSLALADQQTIDGLRFVFNVKDTDVITLPTSSGLLNGQPVVQSPTSGRNIVDVVATKLAFTNNFLSPNLTLVNLSTQQTVPIVEALDANNNRDLGYNSNTINISNAGAIPMLNVPPTTSMNAGLMTWTNNFQYSGTGNGQITVVTSNLNSLGGTPTPATSAAVTVQVSSSNTIITPSAPLNISSLSVTSPGVPVFNFVVREDGVINGDGANTLISSIVITPHATNGPNWAQSIAGARLSDGGGNFIFASSITAGGITFSGINTATLGFIGDGSTITPSTKTYTLQIWLSTSIPIPLRNNIDNQNFVFEVMESNITTVGLTSKFNAGEKQNSGSTNVAMDVVTDRLIFTTDLLTTLLPNKNISLQQALPVIEAVDQYLNRDINYTTSNLSISTAGASFTNAPPASGAGSLNAGIVTFPANFQYTTVGNGTLTVHSTPFVAGKPADATNVSGVTVQAGTSSSIIAGAAAPATITPSPATTNVGSPVTVFNFTIYDDPNAAPIGGPTPALQDDGSATIITQIRITKDAVVNNITNWQQAIASATLTDGVNSMTVTPVATLSGQVNANDILFTNIQAIIPALGTIADGTTITPSSKNYTLQIALNTSLGGTLKIDIDNKEFGFQILTSGVTTSASGTGMLAAQSQSSGVGKDVVTVIATKLDFTQLPFATPPTAANPFPAGASQFVTFSPQLGAEAHDQYGNLDLDFNGAITSFTKANSLTTSSDPTLPFSAGQLIFPAGFMYTSGNNQNGAITITAGPAGAGAAGAVTSTSPVITIISSNESWVKPDPSFTFMPKINYINYRTNDILPADIVSGTNSVELARILLSDGDADAIPGDPDGAGTALTAIRIAIRDAADVSTMGHIKRIAIYNGTGTELAEKAVTGTDVTNGYIDFSGLNIVAPDNNIPAPATISIRASFNQSSATIIDQTLLRVRIEGATLGGGSQFAAGVAGNPAPGLTAPLGVNIVNAVATKLDFLASPSPIEGLNETVNTGQVQARDQFNIVDFDFNAVASVTAPAAPNGTFNFIAGIMDLGGFFTYSNTGDGTLVVSATTAEAGTVTSTVNSPAAVPPNVATPSNTVNVIHINAGAQTGGASGVPSGTGATLQAGTPGQPIFGIQFKAPYAIAGPEPQLNGFNIDFSTSFSTIFTGFKIIESTSVTPIYNPATPDIVSQGIATVNTSSNPITVNFTTPRSFLASPYYTYFLVADVLPTVNGSTSPIQISVVDGGLNSSTASNVLASSGSQLVSVQSPTYSFASIQPPSLTSSYPALAQNNIDSTQPQIELTFSVPVYSLDRQIILVEDNGGVAGPSVVCPLTGAPYVTGVPGVYTASPLTDKLAQPLKFDIPGGFMQPGKKYYVTVAAGSYNGDTPPGSLLNAGIMDFNKNVFGGISYASKSLYFLTSDGLPPKLLGAGTVPVAVSGNPAVSNLTSNGATINATFDKTGTAYFLVLKNAPGSPQIQEVDGTIPYSIPANVVAQGSFPINATVTLPNSGIILPAGGAFTANTTHYVWIIAKGTIEKNHIPSPLVYLPVTAGPFGGPPALTQGTAGPTFTFTSPAAGNNASGPGGPFSSPNVVSNNVVASFCSNSYQVLNTPIVFYEGTSLGQQFFGAGTQTVNLCLPAGFTFDVSTTAGIPNFGKVLLQGSDFPFGANSGSLTYLSPTVVRISFVNTGNVSRDQIIISNLRVISSGATTGRIFRLGGSGLPTITDLTNVASLRAIDAPVQNFDNSYSLSLLPPPTSVETAIPDNYVTPNALVTLFPIVPASQSYDTGPSTFSGQGITGNNLNLNGVTLDAPFNITINHTDQNGCISNNAVQYVVYDHNVGIKITDVNAPAQPTNNGPYCAINPQFQINNTLPASGAGVTRYIRFDNLTVYNLVSLKAEIPVTSTGLKVPPGPPYINPQDYSGDWTTAIKTTPTPVPPGASLPLTGLVKRGASTVVVGNTYYDYSFSDLPIVNANVASTIPYIYEMGAGTTAPFKRNTNPNQNYRTTPAGPPVAATFYTGGSLGFVELTGNFKNVSNPAVSINRRQTIEFFAPPVPIVEVASPYSFLDTGDANNLPGSGPSTPGINNPGTMVYCQAEGDINFNGWPSATAGVSKGTFTLLKAPFNPYSLASIIYDADPRDAAGVSLGAPVTPPGFTDNGNGTSKLTPTLINNGFADIMVRYTFNENGSPCTSFGYQMIRITPNPVANLTWSTFPLTPNAPSASSQCAGQQIQFVSSAFIPPGDASASVNQWAWDFGDVTGTNNLIPMNTTTQTVVHTFNNPSGQGSHYQITHNALSNYGCKSLPTVVSTSPANYVQNLDIGGIPTVKFKLEGVSTADLFGFNSNSTSVKFSTIPGSNLPADNTTISANDIIVNYDWDFGDGTPHTLVSNLTPGYSVSAPGSPGSGVVNSPAGTPNAITAPVNASNINLYNANIATHTYAVTGKQSANLTVTTLLGCVNSLALQNSYRDIVVLPRKVLPAAIPPSTPAGVYVEDFESVATANDWNAWGTGTSAAAISAGVALKSWNLIPSVGTLPPPPSGTKYWKTHNGSGQYNPLEKSALYSPSMDISNLTRPMISFNTLVQTNISDGVVLEFSTDDLNIADPNKKWQSLGTLTDGQDWYNAQGIAGRPGTQAANDYGWSGYINDPIATSTPLWLSSKHTLDAVYPPINVGGNPAKTVFRFALGVAANNAVNVGPGFVLDNVRIGDRTRTILLESFMNSSNTNAAEKVQNEFINNYISGTIGTEVIKINYHTDFPGPDPLNQDSPADPSARALFYNISKTPKSVLDGSKDVPQDRPADIWVPATYAVRTLQLAQADIQVTATSGADGKLHISASVTASVLTGIPSSTVLHIAILEQTIDKSSLPAAKQSLIKSGETTFTWTLKKLVPTASGIPFGTVLPFGNTRQFPATGTYDWAPDPTKLYPAAGDLAVAVWLQQDVTPFEVYQVDIVKSGINDPPLVTALEPIDADKISVYPIPANQEMHIQLPGMLAQPATLQMVDQVGKVSLQDGIPAGARSKVINTRELSSGVYILQIDVGNGNITRKKILIAH